MEVVLLKDNEHLGNKGAVVQVADGFARNFLFPARIARELNPAMKKHLTAIGKQRQKKVDREREAKKQDIQKLETGVYTIQVKTAENGKLFGTVTHAQIAEVLSKGSGLPVDKRTIVVEGGIKKTGEYSILVKYFPGLEAKVKLKVEREAELKD
jgi:large subunit ribosomal protein L9